jgi:hypothetical protein
MARLWPWARQQGTDEAADWSEDEKTGRLLNEEFSKLLDVQRQAGAGVDTKASVVAAAALAGTQFIAAQKHLYVPMLVATLLSLAVAIGLAYAALTVREFTEVPDPSELYFKHRDSHAAEILFELAVNKAEAFDENATIYKRKAGLQQRSLWVLVAAALFAVAARLLGG